MTGAATIAHLGIPTRDRPEALRRCLHSFLFAEGSALLPARFARAPDALVIDTSTSGEARAATAAAARALPAPARYAGAPEIARYLQALAAEAHLDAAAVARLLTPDPALFSAGASRNLLLLDAAGALALQADDDTCGPVEPAPEASPEVRVAGLEDPTEIWPEPAPPSAGEAPAISLVEAHATLLGRAPDRAIVATHLGLRGDHALGSAHPLLFARGATAERLFGSGLDHRAIFASRRLVRAARAPSISGHELCMAYAIGLDLNEIVPPFPAAHRNEDGLFGASLAVCRPAARRAWLPWTVAHEPPVARRTSMEDVIAGTGRTDANDLLGALFGVCRMEIDTRDPAAACASLGRALGRWALADDRALFAPLRFRFAARLAERLRAVETLLRAPERASGRWAAWRTDAEQLAFVLRERIEDPDSVLPVSLLAACGRRGVVAAFRDHAARHAELLLVWPRLFDAARALRARGIELGER